MWNKLCPCKKLKWNNGFKKKNYNISKSYSLKIDCFDFSLLNAMFSAVQDPNFQIEDISSNM